MEDKDKKEIFKIISSDIGRKLITSMLLVQPITALELKKIVKLCFLIFQGHNSIKERYFPNIRQNTSESFQLKKLYLDNDLITESFYQEDMEKNIYYNSELYGKKNSMRGLGILPRAIKCGLIKVVPSEKNKKSRNYYFLNSDIIYNLSKNGVEICINSSPFIYKHRDQLFLKRSKNGAKSEKINERLSLLSEKNIKIRKIDTPNSCSLNWILNSIKWWHEHVPLMNETYSKFIEKENKNEPFYKKDLPAGWKKRPDLLKYAFRDKVFSRDNLELSPGSTLDALMNFKYSIGFCRNYEILRCFSNFEEHLSDLRFYSPMKLLEKLTSEKYTIIPSKRPLVFTSIIAYEKFHLNVSLKKKVGQGINKEPEPKYVLKRNSQIVDNAFNLFTKNPLNILQYSDKRLKEYFYNEILPHHYFI
jgi:hypothetical protein